MSKTIDRPPTSVMAFESSGGVSRPPFWTQRDTLLVSVLILLALLRGLLYASVQWPWYAPDETDHVEYALLTRLHGPFVDTLDRPLRQAIIDELQQWSIDKLWAGQINRQPFLYYAIAGLFASLAPSTDLTAQLQAMRLFSVLIGALTVAATYLGGRIIAPASPLLALGLAGVALFQTTLGTLSGAVTNDGLAILAVTLTLVACIALVRRPAPARRYVAGAAAVIATLALVLFTKRTALVALAPAAVALIVASLPAVRMWLARRRLLAPVAVLTVACIAALPLAVVETDSSQVSGWILSNATRAAEPPPLGGNYALLLGANGSLGQLQQVLSSQQTEALRGERVTLGIWLRLAQPGDNQTVFIRLEQYTGGKLVTKSRPRTVSDNWKFHSLATAVAADALGLSVIVAQETPTPHGIMVGNPALVQDDLSNAAAPVVTDSLIYWADEPITNLLRNPDFESSIPFRLRPWLHGPVEKMVARDAQTVVSRTTQLVENPEYFMQRRQWLVESFLESMWGRLGRLAEINMPVWWYRTHAIVLAAATVGAVAGALLAVARRRVTVLHLAIGALLSATMLAAGAMALGPYVLGLYTGPPFGRYFLVALLPVTCLYVGGLVWIWPASVRAGALLLLLGVLATLDAYVLFYALPAHFSIAVPGAT